MSIENYIRYRNPLGHYVEDYVSKNQLLRLINLGFVKPYDYQLGGNFRCCSNPSAIVLRFHFYVR